MSHEGLGLLVGRHHPDGSPTTLTWLDRAIAGKCWRVACWIHDRTGSQPVRQARIAVLAGVPLAVGLAVVLADALTTVLLPAWVVIIWFRLHTIRRMTDVQRRMPDLTLDDVSHLETDRGTRLSSAGITAANLSLLPLNHSPVTVGYCVLWACCLTWPLYACTWMVPPGTRLRDRAKAAARRLAELARSILPKPSPLPSPACGTVDP